MTVMVSGEGSMNECEELLLCSFCISKVLFCLTFLSPLPCFFEIRIYSCVSCAIEKEIVSLPFWGYFRVGFISCRVDAKLSDT